MKMHLQKQLVVILMSIASLGYLTPQDATGAIHHYSLSDHPSGNLAPPTYGLRLDDLQGTDDQDYTFSFDHSDAGMVLTYDDAAGTVEIAGKAYWGLDAGPGYDPDNSGLFEIKFTYTIGVAGSVAPSGLTVSPEHVDNNGTIKFLSGNWKDTQTLYNLTDHLGGHADSFLFLADGR